MNTAFIKLATGRFINMVLVADVLKSKDGQNLNLYPAGGRDEAPVAIASLPIDSDDARAVLLWLNDHSGVAGVA